MTSRDGIEGIAQISAQEAWDAVLNGAALIDVRTRAEWTFVGLPDLSAAGGRTILIEWKRFPEMSPNVDFVAAALDALGDPPPSEALFLCRSGARSQEAAMAVQAALDDRGAACRCCNVFEGFEGDLGPEGRRGAVNGWKARGLPWRQT